ncbi:hypothetical protein JKJ07_32915 [Actinoplanes sp. LDG1-01]|uniref:Uncharacterized protein n=1 Tax=Paractinoplanes lichenicola TaxID=2802976 RepID=A0ABS1VXU6_9ACTN|nr:hypothetical protein [Actinoplanes lichenicola]
MVTAGHHPGAGGPDSQGGRGDRRHLLGPVIGGAALVMFATVTAVGIRSLRRVTFDGNRIR